MTIKKTWTLAFVCLAMASLNGCYRHTFVVGKGGNTDAEPAQKFWQSHWIAGLIGGSEVDVARVCPSGNATLKDDMSFLNSLVSGLLAGIYSPTTVSVYCGEGKTASLRISPEELRAIALAPATLAWASTVSQAKAAELADAIDEYRSHKNVAANRSATAF